MVIQVIQVFFLCSVRPDYLDIRPLKQTKYYLLQNFVFGFDNIMLLENSFWTVFKNIGH